MIIDLCHVKQERILNLNNNNPDYENLFKMTEIDRKRIASDLHDTSLQTLAHITHQIELASLYIDKDPLKAKLELAGINKEIRGVIDEIRNTIFDLRPMTFDDIGLKEAIEREVVKIDKTSDISYSAHIDDINISDDFVKLMVLRIVQECVKNCEKHSKADKVDIRITQDEFLHIIIEDDGVGMDIDNIPGVSTNHFGYTILSDRIETLGGSLDIKSSLGGGTQISVDIPVA